MEADIIEEPFFITMLAVRAEEDVWTRSTVKRQEMESVPAEVTCQH